MSSDRTQWIAFKTADRPAQVRVATRQPAVPDHDDYATEPVPGLPAHLPAGERMLWQGQPQWWSLAIHAFHVRKVAIYFAILCAIRIIYAMGDGDSFAHATRYILVFAPFGIVAAGLLTLLAWGHARKTIYTITTKRVVIRSGIALEVTVNLPFNRIEAASLHVHRDGTGDLPLRLNPADRIAVLAIWPSMRPGRITRPQPMLRSVPEPAEVAKVLGSALAGVPVTAHLPAQGRPDMAGASDFSHAT